MKLENQVVSLELAKKMKDLGFKQDSLWWWVINQDSAFTDWGLESQRYIKYYKKDNKEYYSAFTVAELGEMLPVQTIIDKQNSYFDFYKEKQGWFCVANSKNYKGIMVKIAENLADAMAKMLIWLKENSYL